MNEFWFNHSKSRNKTIDRSLSKYLSRARELRTPRSNVERCFQWGTVTLTLESVSLQIIRIMGCKWGRMVPLRQQPRTLTVFESLPSFYTPLEPTFSSSEITSSIIKNHDKTYLLYAVSIWCLLIEITFSFSKKINKKNRERRTRNISRNFSRNARDNN